LIPKLTDGLENQTLSRASQSTHAFKWTLLWCLTIKLPLAH
jgi:hypothetical protein